MGENEDTSVPSKKQPPKTFSKATNLRAAALQAFTKAQDPWGSKNAKASKSIRVLSANESRWYALDFAMRKLMEYIQESDPTSSAYISQPATIQLRKLVLDVLSESALEGMSAEYTYEFPDPEIVAQNEARKRQESQVSSEDRKARQKLMAEQKAARQLRMQQKLKEAGNENENPATETKDSDEKSDEKQLKEKSKRSSKKSPRTKRSKSRDKREKIRKSSTEEIIQEKSPSSETSPCETPSEPEEHEDGTASPKSKDKKKSDSAGSKILQLRGSRDIVNGTRSLGRPPAARPSLLAAAEETVPKITLKRTLVNIDQLHQLLESRLLFALPELASLCKNQAHPLGLEIYHLSIKGPRPANEDEYTILHHANDYCGLDLQGDQFTFIGVYDGHSGGQASLYTRSQLHMNMAHCEAFPHDMNRVIREGFLQTDALVNEIQQREQFACGSTALSVWIRDHRELFVGNVGDCRGYLSRAGKPVELALAHSPALEEEKDRIKAAGGSVVWFGAWRVNGILAVSRSIGDHNLKSVVIADPDFRTFELDPADEFLVLASDGLWDVFSAEECLEAISRVSAEQGRKVVCKTLCDMALERNTKDNVTVVVLFFSQLASNQPDVKPG